MNTFIGLIGTQDSSAWHFHLNHEKTAEKTEEADQSGNYALSA